jgi:RNA polymerase sigma-70 factor (ECF subfamily)
MARRRRPFALFERLRSQAIEAPADAPDASEFDSLRRALGRIDAGGRLVLVLRFYLDLSNEEVGRTLGISATAARNRVHRALKRLRPVIDLLEDPIDG